MVSTQGNKASKQPPKTLAVPSTEYEKHKLRHISQTVVAKLAGTPRAA